MESVTMPAGAGSGFSWTNPNGIISSDNSRASFSMGAGATSHPLRATAFGFLIPMGSTILGITVDVERSRNATCQISNSKLKLLQAGIPSGTAKNDSTDWPPSNDATVSYGGSSDLWDGAWTPDDINDANFGVQLIVTAGVGSILTARVDFIQITITYELP